MLFKFLALKEAPGLFVSKNRETAEAIAGMIAFMAILFGILGLGGWEMVLILAVVLLLFGARQLPDLRHGLREGFSQFRKHSDRAAHDAGESLGGIYGKPAAEALTPNNQTAELYDPAAFRREKRDGRASKWKVLHRFWRFGRSIWYSVLARLNQKVESQ